MSLSADDGASFVQKAPEEGTSGFENKRNPRRPLGVDGRGGETH